MLNRAHLEDVVIDVDLQFERVTQKTLELHDVEKDRPVLDGANEDWNAVFVRRRQEGGLGDAERLFDFADVFAQEMMKLGRRHLSLEIGPAKEGRKELIRFEECLFPETEIVDSDDSGQPILKIARGRVDFADAVPDDSVGVVIEIGAGGRHAVH